MNAHADARIILVEDDADLAAGWGEVFDLLGFRYSIFQQGQKAVADEPAVQSCDLLITDYYLPDINGVDLVKKLRKLRPDLRAIVLTGSRELSVVDSVRQLGNCHLLHKPVSIDDLEKKIDTVLEEGSKPLKTLH